MNASADSENASQANELGSLPASPVKAADRLREHASAALRPPA